MSVGVQIPILLFQSLLLILLVIYPEVELLLDHVVSLFTSVRNPHIISHSGCTIFCQQFTNIQFLCIIFNVYYFCVFSKQPAHWVRSGNLIVVSIAFP